MPVTVAALLRDPALGLRVCTRTAALDRPLSWVHVSELPDPAPFLDGGELLLTTGLALGDRVAGYVERLVDAGTAALGFGTGVVHDAVPPALVVAAEERGLAVVEVPRQTPFIALSRGVATALAAEEYAVVARSAAAQQDLARAALGAGAARGVLERLTRSVGGWALLLDPSGHPVESVPPEARTRVTALRAELDRLRRTRTPASTALSGPEGTVLLQSLGTGAHPRGYLVVGRNAPVSPAERLLVNTASMLLTLRSEQSRTSDRAMGALRSGLLRLLMAGERDVAVAVLADLGEELPAEPLTVLAALGEPAARAAASDLMVARRPRRSADAFFAAEVDGALIVVAAADGAPTGQGLAERLPELAVGVSDPVSWSRLAAGVRQARDAAGHAARTGGGAAAFRDLAAGGITGLLPSADARAFAESLLAPLLRAEQAGAVDLVRSLRGWLAHHGQWEPAAAELDVHRHTLRKRIRRVQDLLGRDLDSAGVRAELWVALQILS